MNDKKTREWKTLERKHLEWSVWWMLKNDIITMSKGRELLNFRYMNEMREWYNKYLREQK